MYTYVSVLLRWCVRRGDRAAVQVRLLPPESETPPTCLMGDPDRLKGVLLNLYSNAAKFTRSGFICVRVRRCLANEVASETLLNPERSYKQCLEALQRGGGGGGDGSLSDYSGVEGTSMEAAAAAATESPWWKRWLDAEEEPAWEAWRPCSLPPTGSPPGSTKLQEPANGDASGGAILTLLRVLCVLCVRCVRCVLSWPGQVPAWCGTCSVSLPCLTVFADG